MYTWKLKTSHYRSNTIDNEIVKKIIRRHFRTKILKFYCDNVYILYIYK